jgi:hypothetical protein
VSFADCLEDREDKNSNYYDSEGSQHFYHQNLRYDLEIHSAQGPRDRQESTKMPKYGRYGHVTQGIWWFRM